MLAVAATCLVAALVGAPTAGAAAKSSNHTSVEAQASVTKKKLARDIASVRRRTNAARRTLRTLGGTLATLQNTVNGLRTSGEGTQGQVNGILAAVPQVLDALTQLRDGSLALRNGLETLASETKKGFDTVAAGVADAIKTLATSTEYGVSALYTFAPGDDANADSPTGRTIAAPSADLPDNGTLASASGELPIAVVPSGAVAPNRVPPGTKIAIGSSIKSNEADGNATGDPAGYVGALLMVTCAGGGGAGGCGDEGSGAGQPEFKEGQLICVVGPTALSDIPLPTTPPSTIPQALMKIQEKVSWTDPDQPKAVAFNGTNLVNPLQNAQNSSGAGSASEGTCTLPSFGAYLVKFQTQFVDVPTSASPGLTD